MLTILSPPQIVRFCFQNCVLGLRQRKFSLPLSENKLFFMILQNPFDLVQCAPRFDQFQATLILKNRPIDAL